MMLVTATLLTLAALLLAAQLTGVVGRAAGVLLAAALVGVGAGSYWLLAAMDPVDAAPANWAAVGSVPSEACYKCHQEHYESWYRTYHRTMTREATPADVKGDFDNATYDYQGLTTKLMRTGDHYVMETVDPAWALRQAGGQPAGPPKYQRFKVDRLVGSHWVQEYLHQTETGKYLRLPVLYHIVEQKWVHAHGAFLAPESPDFWGKSRGFAWNDTCLFCHNTGPVKNPVRTSRGEPGYQTQVAELGISCEACHGPAADHVRLNTNPPRRFALQSGQGDPSIVNPLRLSVERRDEVCARCHGAIWPKAEAWDRRTVRDPFIAGQPLGKFNHFYQSEAELSKLAKKEPSDVDGRFWGDGTPLTTALEYTGMALSACYEKGHGTMSCLSCHQMHGSDPDHLLKPGMRTNEACYQCHEGYRADPAAHTRHAADSDGSLCVNCHMPHVVYSLFTTHRSHRIQNPDLADSVGTGKPHACNLCHLDKSLGWTREQLGKWSDRHRGVKLSAEEETYSAALLLLTRGDARSRAIVAGALSQPAARKAAGTDWYGPVLTRLLEQERYPMVRKLLYRGLTAAHGDGLEPFDYLALPRARGEQVARLKARFDRTPVRRSIPGLPDEGVLKKLLETRHDPDLTINE